MFWVFCGQNGAVASEGLCVPALFPQDTASALVLPARRATPERQHFEQVRAPLLLLHSDVQAISKVFWAKTTQLHQEKPPWLLALPRPCLFSLGWEQRFIPQSAPVTSPLKAHWQQEMIFLFDWLWQIHSSVLFSMCYSLYFSQKICNYLDPHINSERHCQLGRVKQQKQWRNKNLFNL